MENWTDFEKFLMSEIKDLRQDITDIKTQLSVFKAKMAAIGSITAIVVTAVVQYILK
jgi:hypothetical protein